MTTTADIIAEHRYIASSPVHGCTPLMRPMCGCGWIGESATTESESRRSHDVHVAALIDAQTMSDITAAADQVIAEAGETPDGTPTLSDHRRRIADIAIEWCEERDDGLQQLAEDQLETLADAVHQFHHWAGYRVREEARS